MTAIGSLCTGYSGLDSAVSQVLCGDVAWMSDVDPGASSLLAHRFPGIPNVGDITAVDWASLGPVDILEGGIPCFAAGTMILTRRGYVPIEDVVTGDEVLTHLGRWKPVTSAMARDGAELWRVRAPYPVITTAEHPFYTREQGRIWNNGRRSYERTVAAPGWTNASELRTQVHRVGHVLPPVEQPGEADGAWWWVAGRYVADGYLLRRKVTGSGKPVKSDQGRVVLCCGKGKEEELRKRLHLAGLKATEAQERTVIKFHLCGQDLYQFCKQFGTGAAFKSLPASALALPPDLAEQLLSGYLSGDGHQDDQGSYATTTSKALALGIVMLAHRARGVMPSIGVHETAPTTVIEGRTVNQRPWWRVGIPHNNRSAIVDGAYGWRLVKGSEALGRTGRVYNISVAGDESYIADGVIVHNCQPFSAAGKRKGTADERHLWPYMAAGIAALRPALVVVENVQGLVGRGLTVVLSDLAGMGYDAAWTVIGASDAGAPHRRKRLFVLGVRDGLDAPDRFPVAVLDAAGWKTPGAGLFGPVAFAGRVPDHGIMTGGEIRARKAPVITAPGLALPTPCAHDTGNTPENHLRKKPGRRQVTSLQAITEHGLLETGGLLPTPRVSGGSDIGERPPSSVSGAHGLDLGPALCELPTPQAAGARRGTEQEMGGQRPSGAKRSDRLATAMLRTPTAQLAVNGGSQHPDKRIAGGHGPTLADEIEYLSTPRASDGGAGRGSSAGWGLRNEAREITPSLPTPAARDYRSGKSNIMDRNARPLNEVIEHLPTPCAADGDRSSATWGRANPTLTGAILPTPNATGGGGGPRAVPAARTHSGPDHGPRLRDVAPTLPTPQASDWKGSGAAEGRDRDGRPRTAGDADLPEAVEMLPTPRATDGTKGGPNQRGSSGDLMLPSADSGRQHEVADDDGDLEAVVIGIAGRRRRDGAGDGQLIMPGMTVAPARYLSLLTGTAEAWGKYAPGIARWETVLGRPAPPPTQPGRDGKPRLSPLAVEFMMGLPPGWVCGVPGLSRSQMLKLLGNGVVPQQGALALSLLADLLPARIRDSLWPRVMAATG